MRPHRQPRLGRRWWRLRPAGIQLLLLGFCSSSFLLWRAAGEAEVVPAAAGGESLWQAAVPTAAAEAVTAAPFEHWALADPSHIGGHAITTRPNLFLVGCWSFKATHTVGADAPGRIWPTRKRRRLSSREVLPPRPPVLTCGAPTPQTRRWICSGNHFTNWRSQMPTKLNALRRTHGNLRATTMLWRADTKAKHMHGANSGTPTTTPRLAQRSGLNLCSSDIPVLTKERTLVMQGIY